MERLHIGEFEEIVLLTIMVLGDQAYGISIKDDIEERIKRKVSVGAMRTALNRLEKKDFLTSRFGEVTKVRGGKRKRYFSITLQGKATLEQVMEIRKNLWNRIPSLS